MERKWDILSFLNEMTAEYWKVTKIAAESELAGTNRAFPA
jgi:hypothetical protein